MPLKRANRVDCSIHQSKRKQIVNKYKIKRKRPKMPWKYSRRVSEIVMIELKERPQKLSRLNSCDFTDQA